MANNITVDSTPGNIIPFKKGTTGKKMPHYQTNSSGGSRGGGNMEARIAKLEATTEHIQTDITGLKNDAREIRNGGIGAFVILASLILGLLAWSDSKFDGVRSDIKSFSDVSRADIKAIANVSNANQTSIATLSENIRNLTVNIEKLDASIKSTSKK